MNILTIDRRRYALDVNGVKPLRAGAVEPPNPGEVEICKAWLRQFGKPRAAINRRCTSYGLKHAVEKWLEARAGRYVQHVANGAFIQAAIELGYDVSLANDGINVHINVVSNTREANRRYMKRIIEHRDRLLKEHQERQEKKKPKARDQGFYLNHAN